MSCLQLLKQFSADTWKAPQITGPVPQGDVPGDIVGIDQYSQQRMTLLMPYLVKKLISVVEENPHEKAVISICGGSGSGKSTCARVLAYYLQSLGIGTYILSGDNYPRRIPMYNDAERISIFRHAGVRGLIDADLYSSERGKELKEMWIRDIDADPSSCQQYPWLATYQKAGRAALAGYLGTENEQDFKELEQVLSQFKNGASSIWLKRMGRTDTELWYDNVDFTAINVIILEWTHGNSDGFFGVDVPIFLNSTPKETALYRRLRARDGQTDSPFVTMVLEIEQAKLDAQAHKAAFILTKDGRLVSYAEYKEILADELRSE